MKVAFYKGTRTGWQGLYSRAVRWIDRGPYSHCELIFSDGICASSSYIDGGVRLKAIVLDPARWDIVDVAGGEAEAREWFTSRQGAKYDVMGNARFVFGLLPDTPGAYFCSEAVAASLGYADAWRLGPNGLHAVLVKCQSDTNSKGGHD